MGLDVSHDCWHGAYSAFHRFRVNLAKKVGVDLNAMEGFGRPDWNAVTSSPMSPVATMKWSALKPDPLWVLLNHSDCEGEIELKDCRPLATRLRELAAQFEPGEDAGGHLPGMREACLTFAEGLERADAAGENVKFH